jgi:RNA recognition motif-containing protein
MSIELSDTSSSFSTQMDTNPSVMPDDPSCRITSIRPVIMNERKLFVGNLKYTVTEEQLMGLFAPHAEVLDIKIMDGKGYAFVEFANPQQAQRVKSALREKEFEGRRLLLDDVPSRQFQAGKPRPGHADTRRSAPSGRDSHQGRDKRGRRDNTEFNESVRHLTDVTDEFRKQPKVTPPPVPKSSPATPKKADPVVRPQGQRPTSPVDQKPPARQKPSSPPGKKPANTEKKTETRQRSIADTGRSTPSEQKRATRPAGKPLKKEKEKPPKNPHPYQGSKKKNSVSNKKQESNPPAAPDENEKHSFLRYWATISTKKKE